MYLYRLSLTKYANDLSGEGARLFGGRWNKQGTPCVYSAGSRALAILEWVVHLTENTAPPQLSIITIKVPDEQHRLLKPNELPATWNDVEASEETRSFGTSLLEKMDHLIVGVPSVIVPREYNFIINPLHPDMKKVSITEVMQYSFDTRLKK